MNEVLYKLYQKYGRENRAEGKAEGRVEGRAEGKAEERSKYVLSMYNKGLDENAISYLLDMDIETVREILK